MFIYAKYLHLITMKQAVNNLYPLHLIEILRSIKKVMLNVFGAV